MAERKAAKTTKPKASQTFTAEERAAMREDERAWERTKTVFGYRKTWNLKKEAKKVVVSED